MWGLGSGNVVFSDWLEGGVGRGGKDDFLGFLSEEMLFIEMVIYK